MDRVFGFPSIQGIGLDLLNVFVIKLRAFHIEFYFCDLIFKQLCFSDNLINGRKLITLDASSMPRTGITDFEHIKVSMEVAKFENTWCTYIGTYKLYTHAYMYIHVHTDIPMYMFT